LGFLDIPRVVGMTLDRMPAGHLKTLADVYEADRRAREVASQLAELSSATAR
jgi:1-deoxy-D-xylulose 5-phosphate reductoisomerase